MHVPRRTTAALALAGAAALGACTGSPTPATTTTTTTSTTTTVAATTTSSTTSTTSTSTTSTTSTTTTTTIPFVTEGAIVLVANAAQVPGAATRLTEALTGRGFTVLEPTDAAGWEERLDTSKIYVAAGAEQVADSISRLLGGIPVSRMPTPPPIDGALDGLGDATVLVMLGRDLAETL